MSPPLPSTRGVPRIDPASQIVPANAVPDPASRAYKGHKIKILPPRGQSPQSGPQAGDDAYHPFVLD